MFKLMGFLMKTALFALLILVMGQVIRWNGRTVSDQVKSHLAQAQRSTAVQDAMKGATRTARNVAGDLADDVKLGAAKAQAVANEAAQSVTSGLPKVDEEAKDLGREIAPTERQKLRSLIQELNRSHSGNR